jgi:ankyrin
MEGEALASRILELGPSAAKFLGSVLFLIKLIMQMNHLTKFCFLYLFCDAFSPVIIEVPHFAALRGKEREIIVLRSDNGETWKEHTLEATEEAVQEVLNESFDGEGTHRTTFSFFPFTYRYHLSLSYVM